MAVNVREVGSWKVMTSAMTLAALPQAQEMERPEGPGRLQSGDHFGGDVKAVATRSVCCS